MFPHQNDRGCTSMGSLGWLHGTGNVHVGVLAGWAAVGRQIVIWR